MAGVEEAAALIWLEGIVIDGTLTQIERTVLSGLASGVHSRFPSLSRGVHSAVVGRRAHGAPILPSIVDEEMSSIFLPPLISKNKTPRFY